MAALGFTTFQDALEYYRKAHPTFLEEFGKAAKSISAEKIKAAMVKVGQENGTNFPDIGAFFDSLGAAAVSWTNSDTQAVVRETVENVQGVLKFGLGTVVIAACVIGGIYLFTVTGGVRKRAAA